MTGARLGPLVRAPRFEPRAWAALPVFAPYRRQLTALEAETRWPPVARYRAILGADVDFETLAGRLPAGLDESDVDGSYIGRCVQGLVPTREGHLHDLMNALTWARFPQAKMALCRRQVDVARARGPQTNRLRTRPQDRLAMVDEGGVMVTPGDGDDDASVHFGHGLLEDAACGRVSRGFQLMVPAFDDVAIAEHIATLDLTVLVR